MKNVRALVVGVSRYYSDDWNTDGPVHNATAMTRWLLDLGVPAENIQLFSDVAHVAKEDAEDLAARGVAAVAPQHHAISRFWRQTLLDSAKREDRLFFFWSGHGMTDRSSNRLFFCGDYTHQLQNNVFNMTEFLAMTRSSAFQQYSSQVLFADVCGTYENAPTLPTTAGRLNIAAVDQFTAFATREGEYTPMDDSSGAFTRALLEVLALIGKRWPDEEAFRSRLEEVSSRSSLQPFTVDIKGKRETIRASFGQKSPDRAAFAKDAFEMLSSHEIGAVQRLHFQRTMVSLGLASFPKVPTLWNLIEELSDLQDARDGRAPYGLVEFLARLQSDPTLSENAKRDILEWLRLYGKGRLREAKERIEIDRETRMLLFKVHHVNGRLKEVESYVRFGDQTPIPGFNVEASEIDSWETLCQSVRDRVEDPKLGAQRGDLQLHFFVDVPLFDLPFHKIQTSDCVALGEQHVCIVHSLRRALQPDKCEEIELWREWAQALGQSALCNVPLRQVQPNPMSNDGICYADFPVLSGPDGTAGKSEIHRIIRLGSPLLCWTHAGTSNDTLVEELREIACQAGKQEDVRKVLYKRRLSAGAVASDLSVLSDEWGFRPFLTTQGAS
ncbi:VMAP-C domain-containing protein (plasmid) [Rhizobium leguminosarum]